LVTTKNILASDKEHGVPNLDRDTAREWIERWDRQQEILLADREDRFAALIDAVQAAVDRPDPLVLDLGCGPGSLAVRLLARLPRATVIGSDADPVTLLLGRTAYGDVPGLRFADVDLRVAGWGDRLELERQPDAVVSTTALHWLTEPALRALYTELADILRPGGIFLDGDHLRLDEEEYSVLARLDRVLCEQEDKRRFPGGHAENWSGWWDAVAADPALASAAAERAGRHVEVDHHASGARKLATHVDALRDAGFAEIGTLWQRGANRLLCAIR
jgi:SAM-dependent methyltransferase